MTKVETMNVLAMVRDGKITVKDGIGMIEKMNRKNGIGRTGGCIRQTVTNIDVPKADLNTYVPKNFF